MPSLSTLDFESGAAGDPIAPENGWSVVGSTGTYLADAAHGALAARFPGIGGAACLTYDVSALDHWRLRMYLRVGSQVQTAHHFLIELRNASDAYMADLQIRDVNGGELWNRWGYSSYTDADPTGAFPRDTWRRVDFEHRFDGASNFNTVHVYDPADDTALDFTLQVPTFEAIATVRVGVRATGGLNTDLDSLALTNGDDPGAYGAAPAGPALTVWDGAAEVPATLTVWDGATEPPATLE